LIVTTAAPLLPVAGVTLAEDPLPGGFEVVPAAPPDDAAAVDVTMPEDEADADLLDWALAELELDDDANIAEADEDALDAELADDTDEVELAEDADDAEDVEELGTWMNGG
jgi:hypothetical protein